MGLFSRTPAADGAARRPVFESDGGELRVNGGRLHLKGVNFFGFETDSYTLHGLWCSSLDAHLDFLASHAFNALRLPFSAELALGLDTIRPTNIDFAKNPGLRGLTAGDQLAAVIDGAAARGMLVMLDLHHVPLAATGISNLWYDEAKGLAAGEAEVIAAWTAMARRYGGRWNVFAADLNNEPHGGAAWGTGCAADWRAGAERIGAALQAVAPHWLLFVEGTAGNARPTQCPEPCWWGGGLCSALDAPVRVPVAKRVVYSPHVYGPGVFMQPYFSNPSYACMPAIWDKQWGFIRAARGAAVVPGEWGGRMRPGSTERDWALAFAVYQRARGLTDSFFWCLNPNSGDTGGLLADDWSGPGEDEAWKLALLAYVNPNPTRFAADGTVVERGGGAAYAPTDKIPPALLAGARGAPPPPRSEADCRAALGGACALGGGGGGGAAVAAAAAPPPSAAPVTVATHPAGLRLAVAVTKTWPAGDRTAHQADVIIVNEGAAPVADVVFDVPAAVVEQSWNCDRRGDDGGRASFSLPEWCTANGGLAPGAEVKAGGVFFEAAPAWRVRPA